jgi:hypothetical protein
MKIISATMAGRGTSKEALARALFSVKPFVDEQFVLNTGLDFEPEVISSREPWVDDFAHMRNTLLQRAYGETHADWILMLDSDETLKPIPGADLRAFLEAAKDNTYSVEQMNGHYAKPRIFRAPIKGKFGGPTHEAYEEIGTPCPLFQFDESAKTPEDYKRKFERDRDILIRHLKSSPENPGRWHFYLGQTYADLGEPRKAIEEYTRCALLSRWDEERAWSQMRIAQELQKIEKWDAAVEACTKGLAIVPGMPELAEQAALASYRAGKWLWSICWAKMAIAIGEAPRMNRTGFRYPSSYAEGPYDVLRYAYEKIGDAEKAAWARTEHERISIQKTEGYDPDIVTRASRIFAGSKGPITVTQTTCKRFDLFERTVDSFLKTVEDLSLISRWIVVDDGSTEDELRRMGEKYPFMEIFTKMEKGHAKSLNLLFGKLVQTELAFHLEDDWQLTGTRKPILHECLQVLGQDPSYGQCLINRNFIEEERMLTVEGPASKKTQRGLSYVEHIHFPDGKHPYKTWNQAHWPGFSLHPSLIRMSMVRPLLPFTENAVPGGFEREFAVRWNAQGIKTTFLDTLHAIHIGRKSYEIGKKPNAYDLNGEKQF